MEKTSTKELFDFVKNETKPKDVIVFFKPRVLALYTNRQSLAIALPDPKGDPLSRMKEFGVNWVITRKIHPREYQPELIQLISENPDRFIPVYENEDFRVFRLAEK
jgi:hypothetical protein